MSHNWQLWYTMHVQNAKNGVEHIPARGRLKEGVRWREEVGDGRREGGREGRMQ